eukprot:sb/3470988/
MKPDNIFVKRKHRHLVFVLGDFGHSKSCTAWSAQHGMWKPRGYTDTHAPPEWAFLEPMESISSTQLNEEQENAYHMRGRHPTAIDIYQMGLVMWQAFSRTSPWQDRVVNPGGGRDMLRELFRRDFLARPEFPTLDKGDNRQVVYEKLKVIVRRCWHHRIESRPSAEKLHNELRNVFENRIEVVLSNLVNRDTV